MAVNLIVPGAAPAKPQPTTFAEWLDYFLPEGEAHVARRQELGDFVANPERAARIYANFAAFDARRGGGYQILDIDRANRIAEIMAGLPSGLERAAA